METKFISIPTKETKDFDWVHPLKGYLTQIYGTFNDFENDAQTFNKLRTDLIHCNKDLIGRDLYYKYYGQLEMLELRVPTDSLKLNFTWFDAFSTSISHTQHSTAFEKASILFNLASILSEIGNNNEDYKIKFDCYQKSSGIFQFIEKSFLHAPSDDLNIETVETLSKIMLAQAQEVFLLKYINENDNPKDSLISKLAKATAKLYNSAYNSIPTTKLANYKWSNYLNLKDIYFTSVANYHHSISLKTSSKIGQAIAYMKQAQDSLKPSKTIFKTYDSNLITLVKNLEELIKNELVALEKDNDFIYHELIPTTTPEIKSMVSCKSIPITDHSEISSIVGKDLFEKVIPLSIHEQSSMYSEEMAKLLRFENEKCEIADKELNSTLEFLNLPKSLDELRNVIDFKADLSTSNDDESNEIDARVLSIAAEISQSDIDDLKQSNLKNQVSDNINKCESILNEENLNFESNKVKYGHLWTQEQYPSKLMSLKQELAKAKKSMIDSSEADNRIENIYSNIKSDIDILKLGPSHPIFLNSFKGKSIENAKQEQLLIDFDDEETESVDVVKSKLDTLNSKLQELRYLQKERSNTYKDLKNEIHKDDISNILILNNNKNDKDGDNLNEIFKQELLKFKPYQERLSVTIDKQIPLIENLKKLMNEILDNSTIKSNIKKRDSLMNTKQSITLKYLNTYENWKVFEKGLKQGLNFYKQLLQYTSNLRFSCDEFKSMRINEGNKLIQEIELGKSRDQELLRQQFSKFSVSSQPSPKTSFSNSVPQQQQQQPPQYQSQPPQYQAYPQNVNSNSFSNAPPLPSKPTSTIQQQNQQQDQSAEFYSTPSAYDPNLYSYFGNQTGHQ
ncbi:hypothetical protein CANARDRAFT_26401 [[Candida] arabinofermentans NRRL YB-2248]|uniref:BRO domain-containing protein 1 n=1 Tax=[Candida] arabinofermentans NRRL YB-2248 TaxID=983967 RepID=A0A1E4T940_9ASCO|nr:hypothetical protein CANARDRAFT_26401 [[Candida] arabinofermentans NRRL YB-2248]